MKQISQEAQYVLSHFQRIPERSVNGNIAGALEPYIELVDAGYIKEIDWPTSDPIAGWKHYRLIEVNT